MNKAKLALCASILLAAFIPLSCSDGGDSPPSYEYLFCVYPGEMLCVPGPVAQCPSGGAPKDVCPPDYSQGNRVPSSSSLGDIGSSSSSRGSSSGGSSSSTGGSQSSSSSTPLSSSSVGDCTTFDGRDRLHYGKTKPQFCDERDGRTYVYVTIGEQTWMAENLNYNTNTSGSKCYDNQESNCDIYGRLYDGDTAYEYEEYTVGGVPTVKTKDICPSGWHLSTSEEWRTLRDYVEEQGGCANCAGTKLKAVSALWNKSSNSKPQSDTWGFSALPNGVVDYSYWWTASKDYSYNDERDIYIMFDNNAHIIGSSSGKAYFRSVRCVKND